MNKPLLVLLLLSLVGLHTASSGAAQGQPALVPWPAQTLFPDAEPMDLFGGGRIVAEDPSLLPLAKLLGEELERLTGMALIPILAKGEGRDIVLRFDPEDEGWDPRGYRFAVRDAALVSATSYAGVARGTGKLLQALVIDGSRAYLPQLVIEDAPAHDWRGVMIDCARHTQPLEVLLQVVDLCRFYSLSPLHLHLTDDQAFTFPSKAFPQITSRHRSYSRAELAKLVAYAQLRGVELVPEIDLPGHSSALVSGDPERFGLANWEANRGLVNLAREETLRDIETLLGEVAEVFPHSRYLHLGGDEVWLGAAAEDPSVAAALQDKGWEDPRELTRQFLVRMAKAVRDLGRIPAVWEGFGPTGITEIPKDIVVLAWDGAYHHPRDLAAAGHPIVNASWKPLYIVGGGVLAPQSAPRSWSPAEIAAWNVRRWDQWESDRPTFGGFQLGEDQPVLGGQLCVWEQTAETVLGDLRPRAPILAERTWRGTLGEAPPTDLLERAKVADQRLRALLFPARIVGGAPGTKGRRWIEGALQVAAPTWGRVRYTLDGSRPRPDSAEWTPGLKLAQATTLTVQLFKGQGRALGFPQSQRFAPRPEGRVRATLYDAPPEGWKQVPDFAVMQPAGHEAFPGLRGGLRSGSAGLLLQGTFVAPADGRFEFDLRTYDGPAQLYVDGALVVDRSDYGRWDGTTGSVELSAGAHALEVRFAQGPMHTLCRAFVSGPGIADRALVDRYLKKL